MNLPPLDRNQPLVRQLVQDAREVLLGQVQSGSDDALVRRQGDGDGLFGGVGVGLFA